MSESSNPRSIHLRTVKSFVKRSGRVTKSQQKALNEYSNEYGLNESSNWDFNEIFGNNNRVVLEIGFGDGGNICAMAEKYPEVNFVGVEVYEAGVGKALNTAKEKNLSNIRVCSKDIIDILDNCIQDNSIDKVQIFFPDPWHKSAHHKRRLIQVKFIEKLLPKLKTNNALIHIATDWENYYEHITEVFQDAKLLDKFSKYYNLNKRIFSEELLADSYILNRVETKFERRGIKLGHNIHDLIFKIKN